MQLEMSWHPDFRKLMQLMEKHFPADLLRIDGVSKEHLDLAKASAAFFGELPTVDNSVDPTANVTGKDVITANFELPKALMKMQSYHNLWDTLREMTDTLTADAALTAHMNGSVYVNDVWDIGRPYCFNYSCLDIALEGLKMGGKLQVDPPKSLWAYLRQVEQFGVYAANSTLGATGLADLLIVAARYVDDILATGLDNHVRVAGAGEYSGETDENEVDAYVRESLVSLIYTLNWQFRGNQSPFTNVSVYDSHFLDSLLPGYVINGKAPQKATVRRVQHLFLQAFNDVLAKTPVTFPVITACLSTVSKDGKRSIQDERFAMEISRFNLPFGVLNIYAGESSTLSSCCRLRSSMDLGYSNTFGSGSTKIGSLGVVTLNLPRYAAIARQAGQDDHNSREREFLSMVADQAALACLINKAKRTFLEKRIRRGNLPLYSLGVMDLKRQYSTIGFTGLYEALELLGYDILTEEGAALAEETLHVLNYVADQMAAAYGDPHNVEQVPGETSAVKLAEKDSLLGFNPGGYALYSNQFVPLWANADTLDRIRIQGRLDALCSGGAICHLNIGDRIEDERTMFALISHAVEAGVIYFAVNYQINRCDQGHMSVGRGEACPICGRAVAETFTRVVGFLTSTKNWNRTRREHDWPRRTFTRKGASHA